MSQAPSKQVWIVPHTHWDREWYRPFQDFRVRLVELVDGLMELLEADPSYSKFMLDGQMAVIDDYLEIRPDALEQIEQMAKSGRISLGPWYILMDEFLVSGETIVRDLQLGIMRAEAFGGPMEVGYLPDMFGHIAQMPQILTLAGLDHAIVWRGVPAAIDRTRFTWRSPDGSSVVADYLINGYGNAAALPSDPKAAVEMLRSLDRESESFSFGNSDGILLMNGTDHQAPRTWLAGVVEQMNSMQDSYSLEICGLQDAVTARDNSLPESSELIQWEGELRSSARANLLMGVGSNRIDVKQAAARAERSLERRAEPLAALFAGADRWPDTFFNLAWKQMILNSAHDSICACSVDEVVDAVLARFAEARQIGDTVGDRVLDKFALSLSSPGATVVNLAHRDRSGTIKVIIPGEDVPAGCQLISSRPETLIDTKMAGPQAKAILAELRSQQISDDTFINSVEIAVRYDEIEVCLAASDKLENEFPIDPAKARLSGFIDAHPDLPVHIRATQPPISTVLARTPSVPGFGWRHWAPEIPEQPVGPHGNLGLTNGLVTVEVDPISGTFSLDGIAGFDRLVDGGDHGDTYNFSPPVNDTVVTMPATVKVEILETGPIRGIIQIIRSFDLPERIDDTKRSRVGTINCEFMTRLELHACEKLVRIETSFDNRCKDHRLRSHFPLATSATHSSAECAFAIVDRPLVAEGGPTERGLATYPSRRFVTAGGITVFHEGLLEYELVGPAGESIEAQASGDPPEARELALTLLRANGILSRVEMTYRPLPAGPPITMDGPQMLGTHTVRYGIQVGDCDPYEVADDFLLPLEVVISAGQGSTGANGYNLKVAGAEVSAVRRTKPGGSLELRVFNPRTVESQLEVTDPSGEPCRGHLVDLRGNALSVFEGKSQLRPWQIATIRLAD